MTTIPPTPSPPTSTSDEKLVLALKALASEERLKLLRILRDVREFAHVQFLATAGGISMPLASSHLIVLYKAGLIERDRSGKYVMYRIDHQAVAWVESELALATIPELGKDETNATVPG